jgi:hypothetical protein
VAPTHFDQAAALKRWVEEFRAKDPPRDTGTVMMTVAVEVTRLRGPKPSKTNQPVREETS